MRVVTTNFFILKYNLSDAVNVAFSIMIFAFKMSLNHEQRAVHLMTHVKLFVLKVQFICSKHHFEQPHTFHVAFAQPQSYILKPHFLGSKKRFETFL